MAARRGRAGSVNAIRNANTVRTLRLCIPCARLQHREKRCRACGGETEGCASQGEARRLRDLALLQRAGHVEGLALHPRFELLVDGESVGWAVFDASYHPLPPSGGAGRRSPRVVEDVKGEGAPDDELSKLKRSLVKALYGIEVKLVTPGGLPWTPRASRPRRKRSAASER